MAKKLEDRGSSVTVRLDAETLAKLDKAAGRLRTEEGKKMGRSGAIRIAIQRLNSETAAGAFYPTQREKALLDGLRQMRLDRPDAAELTTHIAELAVRSGTVAEALERFAPLVEALEGLPPPDRKSGAEPKPAPKGQI